jgi:hypothetical protein
MSRLNLFGTIFVSLMNRNDEVNQSMTEIRSDTVAIV